MRKITVICDFNDTSDIVTFTLREEMKEYYESQEQDYDLTEYKTSIELYNKLLDDFDAEYDDEVANGFDRLCMQIFDEKED